jgi:hypothetical protein
MILDRILSLKALIQFVFKELPFHQAFNFSPLIFLFFSNNKIKLLFFWKIENQCRDIFKIIITRKKEI